MKKNRWIAWKKWDDLCQPKVVGGLGFRGLEAFAFALLETWLETPQKFRISAWKGVKSKVFFAIIIFKAKIGMGCSLIWRSISKARELLKQGHRWLVGSCEQILVCKDKWLAEAYDFKVTTKNLFLANSMRVCDLIN